MSNRTQNDTTVGDRLQSERKRLKMSLVAFGDAVGVSKTTQVMYEADTRAPDTNYLARAATVGVDSVYVLAGARSEMSQYAIRETVEIVSGLVQWSAEQRLHPPAEQLIAMFEVTLRQRFAPETEPGFNRYARTFDVLYKARA